ncbi:MAG TPA: RidA family protein, partial [Streptomyces sp.]|nr:RidA family protein [Streptomyces sp.]
MSGERPDVLGPAGHYQNALLHGGLVFSAGMTPKDSGGLLARGRVGEEIPVDRARHLAFLAARRALDAVEEAAGRASQRVVRVVQMTVYLATGAEFTEHSTVADGASRAVTERFPAVPPPARAAVGGS